MIQNQKSNDLKNINNICVGFDFNSTRLKKIAIKLRRKKKVNTCMSLDFNIIEIIRIIAEKEKLSISGLINEILKEYLKNNEMGN